MAFSLYDGRATWDRSGKFAGVSTRTTYGYDDYGNVTHATEYDVNDVPYRQTHSEYYPNTDKWIVNKPGFENVYRWTGSEWSLEAAVWYSYDGHPVFSTPVGDLGELTAVRRWTGAIPVQFVDTRYTYDAWGNRVTETTYDNFGISTEFASLNPKTATTAYDGIYHMFPVQSCSPDVDGVGQLCTTTEYYGVGTAADYGLPGQVKAVTDPNGAATEYRYDGFGRPVAIKAPDDLSWLIGEVSTTFEYPDPGWIGLQRVITRNGRNATWQVAPFDGLGRTIQVHQLADDGQEVRTSTQYDALGRVVKQWTPYYGPQGENGGYGHWGYVPPSDSLPHTTTHYDALGRVVQVLNPDGTATTYLHHIACNEADPDFDHGGRVAVIEIDANGHFTRQSFDAFGRLETVSEMTGVWPAWGGEYRTHYAYDTLGNLTDVWDVSNNHTQMEYDLLGRKTAMDDPDMGHWDYEYDAASNLDTQTDARGCTIDFGYDELNRLTGKAYAGSCSGSPTSYTYDGADVASVQYVAGGNRIIATGDGRSYVSLLGSGDPDAEFTLDVEKSGSYAMAVILHQDSPTSNPGGYSATVDVYVDGAKKGTVNVSGGAGPLYQGYTDWMLGPARSGVFQVSLSASAHTVRLVRTGGNSGVEIAQDGTGIVLDYGLGRRTAMSDGSGSTAWTYDVRGRVTREEKSIAGAGNPFVTQYTYDPLDRVLTMRYPDNEIVTHTYNAQGALWGLAGANTYASNIAYNALGQVTSMPLGNGLTTSYIYEPLNFRLQRIRTGSLLDLGYSYDPVGNITQIADLTFGDTFSSKDTASWAWNSYQTVPFNDGGDNVVKNAGTGSNYSANFYRSAYSLTSGEALKVRFKVDRTDTSAHFAIESSEGLRFCTIANSGKLYLQYNDGSGWQYPGDLLSSLQVNTWYVLQIVVDDDGGFSIEAYQENNPGVRGSYSRSMPGGKAWRFHHWVYRGNAYLDDYREFDTAQHFTYDALDRLTDAEAIGGPAPYSRSYAYNPIGNILHKDGTGDYTYLGNGYMHNQPHAVTHIGGQRKYSYDQNGNMTARTENGKTYTQVFDAENRLKQVTGSADVTFTYDGDGNRVKKVENGVTTYYVGGIYEQIGGDTLDVAPLRYGVACQDNATGSGYIMYSAESVHGRFSENPPNSANADHFICVIYSGGEWKYDNNLSYYAFTPRASDILMAAVNFGADTVTNLAEQNDVHDGIAYGYASGNLTFEANKWGGSYNNGEFYITGSSFTSNEMVWTLAIFDAR